MKYLLAIGVTVLLALTSFGSFKFGTYKSAASHIVLQESVNQLTKDKSALQLSIAEQNAFIEVAKAKSESAVAAQEQAEKHAATMAEFSKSRLQKLENTFAAATSCDAVLKRYWELRQ